VQCDNTQGQDLTGRMRSKVLTRDFILLFFAQFTFSFVFQCLIPTLPIYLSRLGSNEVEIGVIIGTFFFCALVLRPFVGKALLRTPEKKFMITGSLLYCLIFPHLSFRSAFLASFDCESRSGNWIRILPHGRVHVGCQYQPGDPSWAKHQLFCSGDEHLRCLGSFRRNLPHQPLQFHSPVLGLFRSFVLRTAHYLRIGKEADRSIAGFLH